MARSARPALRKSRKLTWPPWRPCSGLALQRASSILARDPWHHARRPTKRPKIRLQSSDRAPQRSFSSSFVGAVPSRHCGGSPTHPLGSPRRTTAVPRAVAGCQGFPSAASPALTARHRPRCSRVVPTGGAAAASGKSRGPPALPLSLDRRSPDRVSSLCLPLGEGLGLRGRRILAPRPKGGRGN
jgi:hypothetical protein